MVCICVELAVWEHRTNVQNHVVWLTSISIVSREFLISGFKDISVPAEDFYTMRGAILPVPSICVGESGFVTEQLINARTMSPR